MEKYEQRKDTDIISENLPEHGKPVTQDTVVATEPAKRTSEKEMDNKNEVSEDEEISEAELENTIRELEKPVMDEEMVNNDDLLGEELHKDSEQIEAISQLSPITTPNTDTNRNTWPLPLSVMEKKTSEEMRAAATSRKKAQNSPDPKGLRASKKLQVLRSHASLKNKGGKGNISVNPSRSKKCPSK